MDPSERSQVPAPVLDAFGLGGGSTRLIEQGNVNRHWRVAQGGRVLVVRRYHAARSARSIRWEHDLMRFSAAKGWPVPVAVVAVSGVSLIEHAGRFWSIHPFLEGTAPADAATARELNGRWLGQLHRDLEDYPNHNQRPGSGKIWDLDVIAESGCAESWESLLAMFARDHARLADAVRHQRIRNLNELSRLHYQDLREQSIHGDFSLRNLLVRGGSLSGVLDFDFSRRDALACDIAPLLMPFQPLDPVLAAALLRGYQSVRPLSGSEWALLPALVRAALLWWVAHLLVRWRVEGVEPAGIARTINQRIPAFDASEPALLALRPG